MSCYILINLDICDIWLFQWYVLFGTNVWKALESDWSFVPQGMVLLQSPWRGCQFEKLVALASKLQPLPNAFSMHCRAFPWPHPRSPWHQDHPSFSMCLGSTGIGIMKQGLKALASCCPHHSNKLQSASDSTMKSAKSNCWTCSHSAIGLNLDLSSKKMLWLSFGILLAVLPSCLDGQNQSRCALFILCIDVSIEVQQ